MFWPYMLLIMQGPQEKLTLFLQILRNTKLLPLATLLMPLTTTPALVWSCILLLVLGLTLRQAHFPQLGKIMLTLIGL